MHGGDQQKSSIDYVCRRSDPDKVACQSATWMLAFGHREKNERLARFGLIPPLCVCLTFNFLPASPEGDKTVMLAINVMSVHNCTIV